MNKSITIIMLLALSGCTSTDRLESKLLSAELWSCQAESRGFLRFINLAFDSNGDGSVEILSSSGRIDSEIRWTATGSTIHVKPLHVSPHFTLYDVGIDGDRLTAKSSTSEIVTCRAGNS